MNESMRHSTCLQNALSLAAETDRDSHNTKNVCHRGRAGVVGLKGGSTLDLQVRDHFPVWTEGNEDVSPSLHKRDAQQSLPDREQPRDEKEPVQGTENCSVWQHRGGGGKEW